MIINVLMILALAIGAGSGQSMQTSSDTAETNGTHLPTDECYINGTWYNPCPPDAAPDPDPPPSDGPSDLSPP